MYWASQEVPGTERRLHAVTRWIVAVHSSRTPGSAENYISNAPTATRRARLDARARLRHFPPSSTTCPNPPSIPNHTWKYAISLTILFRNAHRPPPPGFRDKARVSMSGRCWLHCSSAPNTASRKYLGASSAMCRGSGTATQAKPVIVLATTNRPDAIDPALRRGGRFDTEINIPVPNESIREHILRAQMRKSPLADDVDFKQLANLTAGFVGSDLHDLVGKAGSWQLSQYFEAVEAQAHEASPMDPDPPSSTGGKAALGVKTLIARARRTDLPRPPGFTDRKITMSAFLAVLPTITPSSKREGFATIPDVSWDDIGALRTVREELQTAIVEPIRNPALYASVGISAPTGVLLWGPPGCGKTLLAKAVAAESKANFISIKGPELLNKFVGESEAAVRRVFTRARSSVPCVIFFDELDALVPRRDDTVSESSARVVNTLLTELDGLSERQGIYVIAATNRPDIIDEAMLRPGRLETPLFVDLPGAGEREEILRALLRGSRAVVEDVDAAVGVAGTAACDGYSGADLGALLRQAGYCALRRRSKTLDATDFLMAAVKVKGSVGDMGRYYELRKKFAQRY
ncbi:Ribosome biogenesis ATPase rix7 [Friedmanniomyces endolithicus]|nr:Ribosome biogenesis ATPase rix7 [Friedmanniomyces endolithicus]